VYLIDTHVISKARRGSKANPGVRRFFPTADAAALRAANLVVGRLPFRIVIAAMTNTSTATAVLFNPESRRWRYGGNSALC